MNLAELAVPFLIGGAVGDGVVVRSVQHAVPQCAIKVVGPDKCFSARLIRNIVGRIAKG